MKFSGEKKRRLWEMILYGLKADEIAQRMPCHLVTVYRNIGYIKWNRVKNTAEGVIMRNFVRGKTIRQIAEWHFMKMKDVKAIIESFDLPSTVQSVDSRYQPSFLDTVDEMDEYDEAFSQWGKYND